MDFFKEDNYTPSHKIGIFDKKQLGFLSISVFFMAAMLIICRVGGKEISLAVYRILASLNLFFIFGRLGNYIFIQKNFKADYSLPFHICSFNVIICFLAAVTMNGGFMDYVYAMSPLSAVMALLTPESAAARYPYFNFRSIEYYFSHSCLIVVPLIPLLFFGFRPSFSYFIYFAVIFAVSYVIASALNLFAGGNYMYINHGPAHTPLEKIEKKTDKTFYRIMMIAVYVFLYVLMHLFWL